MKSKSVFRFLVVIVLSLLFCCNQEKVTDQAKRDRGNRNSYSQKVTLLDMESLDHLLNNRNGKVLFLNIWATWCIPCREEFPDIIKLVKEFRDEDVEFVGISVDYPDEIESKINPFIKEQKVNFPIFVQNFPEQEDFIDRLNKEWSGALPATFIFGNRGKLQKFLLGKHSYKEFKGEIVKILASL